jgi:hypothetical protein
MFTIELLAMNWLDREHAKVVQRVPSVAKHLDDANMVAKSLLDHAKKGDAPNAYRILDESGVVVLRSWERAL